MIRSKTVLTIRSPRCSEKLEPLKYPLIFKSDQEFQDCIKDINSGNNSPQTHQYPPRNTIPNKLPKIIREEPPLAERRKSNEPKKLKDMISTLNLNIKPKPFNTENQESKTPGQLDFTFGLCSSP